MGSAGRHGLGERPPAQDDVHAARQLFELLLHIQRFVVAANRASGDIGAQLRPHQPRAVAIDAQMLLRRPGQDFHHGRVARQDTLKVHRLGHTQRARNLHARAHVGQGDVVAGILQSWRRGHTRWHHPVHAQGSQTRLGSQGTHALDAGHVHHIMWIHDDRGGAVGQHGLGKGHGAHQRHLIVVVGR